MAMAIKLVGLPIAGATETWTVDRVMWPIPRLESDQRLRRVNINSGYLDYVGVFTVAEVLALNEEYLVWEAPVEHWAARNREVRDIVNLRSQATSMVVVHLYEWESGLD